MTNSKNNWVYKWSTVDYINWNRVLSVLYEKGSCRKRKTTYFKDIATFDIETTTIQKSDDDYESFMYIAQFYIGGELVILRTWSEFQQLLDDLQTNLELTANKRLVVYVHNLSFEFQFIRNFCEVSEVFATSKREVVKCLVNDCIEFRCSYRLTNMSLDRFLKNQGVEHLKLIGKFDYSKLRTPTTELTDTEMQYCINDVLGLYEGLEKLFESEGDTVATIPITSTGFVRRDFRTAMKSNPKNREVFETIKLTPKLYAYMKRLTRGGNCHANPTQSNIILTDVQSMDMSSAYPAVMCQCKFPMGKFMEISDKAGNFNRYMSDPTWACVAQLTLANVQIKTMRTVAYIPIAKLLSVKEPRVDNGRLLSASYITLAVNDIDWEIISSQYDFDIVEVQELYISCYAYLPRELRELVCSMYHEKCKLKKGDQYLYMKYKNRINSTFGMMLTDICKQSIIYNGGSDPWEVDTSMTAVELLEKFYSSRNSFLSYQWGVWVTSWCRYRLQKAIDAVGQDMVYCDTDSCKFIYPERNIQKFDALNAEIREQAKNCGVQTWYETDGKLYELGVWENDGKYDTFKTMGAKKYAYTEGSDDIHITVAGLSKSKGADYLNAHGKMESFKNGTVVPIGDSGRTVAQYNDVDEPYILTINGEQILTGSNIAIYDTSYTFGMSDEYMRLLGQLAVIE